MRTIVFVQIVLGIVLGGADTVRAESCSADSDCPAGQYCYDGRSQCLTGSASTCTSSTDCPTGEFCASGRCLTGCRTHCDCQQLQLCYYGACLADPKNTTYCCTNPGCPPGARCIAGGKISSCAEDPTWVCQDACDCGPAHCCKYDATLGHGVCVKDLDDPWSPGGTEIGPSCVLGVDPTYCCSDVNCHASRAAYADVEDFVCYGDIITGGPSNLCGGTACTYSGDCAPGESCVDARTESTAAPGASCAPQATTCVSNALAEGLFGYLSTDLLPACRASDMAGTKCVIGWRPGGVYAFERVVATAGSCGNGVCEAWESAVSCVADCRCGDTVCDSTEPGSCASDCATCGDGACGQRETPKTCASDCSVTCGDGSCDAAEVTSCPGDCGCPDSPGYTDAQIWCGDGVCQAIGLLPETCVTCPKDCGVATDADGDNIADCIDPCPGDAQNDADTDGLCAASDNCPSAYNPNQADHNGDGEGDVCDNDDDEDGVPDIFDNCPLAPNSGQTDLDHDAIGDACDADNDNDGILDADDACAATPLGKVVAPDGCSLDQSCPCVSPWKNHGGYLSCIVHAGEVLRKLGLLEPASWDQIVSAAGGSTCGR